MTSSAHNASCAEKVGDNQNPEIDCGKIAPHLLNVACETMDMTCRVIVGWSLITSVSANLCGLDGLYCGMRVCTLSSRHLFCLAR